MAIQQQTHINFGSGRIYAFPPGSLYPYLYPDLIEANVTFKIDTKDAFAEGAYPVAVATGHKSIEIACKHYTWGLDTLANDFSLSYPSTGTNPWVIDEAGTVTGTSYGCVQGALVSSTTLNLRVNQTSGGYTYAQYYKIVAPGSEVAGAAASVNTSTGLITFAAGDAGKALKVDYQFANTSTGQILTGIQTFQNSDNIFKLKLVHRDRSPIDNSTAETIWTFNQVRCTAFSAPYKEGDYTMIDRSFKAFADSFGNVFTTEFVNQ